MQTKKSTSPSLFATINSFMECISKICTNNFSWTLELNFRTDFKNRISLILITVLLTGFSLQSFAQTDAVYDFNTPGQLSAVFNASGPNVANVTESTTGGTGNTGSITVGSVSTNAIFATKDGYSLGPEGSIYTFESFVKSVYNSGYSGLGFAPASPAPGSVSTAYRPDNALGISVHGGGFIFHNGTTNYSGSWGGGSSGGITAVKSSSIGDLLNSGSPDDWYRVVFSIERTSSSQYDLRVEIWSANADGSFIRPAEADAIFEVNGITNSSITSAPAIYSYFSFSGQRVSHFDNYAIQLEGGGTVITEGNPVILTTNASLSGSVITVDGNVTSENGSAVIDRGIVYATSTGPSIADNKVSQGSGTGTFSVDTPALAAGTYYIRTFATNGVGTSYGAEYQITITAPPNNSPTVTSTSITSATAQSLYYYDIKATDADNDVITWTANTVPAWLTFTSGTLQTSFVGTGATPTNTGDGVNQSPDGTSASNTVIRTGTAAHGDNKLFFTDTEEYGIRYVDENRNVQTWYQGDGTYTNLNPVGIAYDVANDAVYVGDYAKSDIVKIDNLGTRTLLSDLPEAFILRLLVNSNGTKLYASARGGIYEIDLANNNPVTNWTRVVGTGSSGYSDTGTASTSQVNQPHGMAFDSAGRLVFTDRFNDIIRRVDLATDTIETIAGMQGAGTEAGDGGLAANATFADPSGLVINEHDEIFISERLSKRIRKIDTNGDIDTFFTVSAGGFADDLAISDAGELYLLTTTLIAQIATKAELTGTPTNADAGVHDVALTLSDGIDNVPYNFQITVQAINIAPTDITLDNNSIGQSATGVDSMVGTLSTTDADSGDFHTYTLVSGTGDTDNSSFNISGNTLRTNSSLAVGNYSIRINTNDGTDDFAKEFTVNVTDDAAPEGYTATIDQDPISSSNQTTISFTLAGAEIGADYDYTFTSDGGGINVIGSGTIATATDQITGIDLSGLGDGSITLSVTLTDTNGNEGVPATDSKTKDVVEPVPNLVIAESLYFGPFTIRLQFSEPVLDLAPNPVLIAPGSGGEQMATLGPLQEVTAGLVYDIQVTPLVPGEIVFYNDLYGMARDEAGNYTIPLGFVNGTYYDLDTDNDGIGNSTDTDDDNDGTADSEDAFPKDDSEDTDTDGDGTGDNADDDADNDGTPDDEDAFPYDPNEDSDIDGDGVGDNSDTDDDNDGVTDTDTDGDGLGDNVDNDDDNDGIPDDQDDFPNDASETIDTDGDGIGDNADTDDDGDGYSDEVELTEGTDPTNASSTPLDTDGDGIPDSMDEDDDNDGVPDADDAFPTSEEPSLVPAQAFTPNGDGNNDAWIIPGIDNYPNNVVKVYNRWGHEVFGTRSYRNNWEGFYKNRNEKLPAGSYMYVINLGDGSAPLQGWIFINY
ncbi:gliding motility-associated C-terminal domain-containing protein [Flagellimonas oceanensis]|uniref:T9SS type B sorting domain-containing protein n=1 Tax=Flagellimonas oceanensis TaxID=2499163 RepID=UPI003BA8D997